MRLLLDHHVSPVVAVRLREAGYDTVTVVERGWQRVSDDVLLAEAGGERRAVVTADAKDFVPMARVWAEQGRTHWGILVVGTPQPLRSDGVGALIRSLTAVLTAHPGDADMRDRVHWL